ncbi:MAG: [FeFe] hydrogenase H-cluster radical SAM maturase HydG [Candidatus Omnitrophica bacterium]|nr:[FeFe] hydrogenase H-cluster radical SAM maturase HydG [Candidatus Omnitrophota bacterium]
MKYINEDKINNLLADSAAVDNRQLENILAKARLLKRLTLKESALLLAAQEPGDIQKIFETASYVKDTIYGRRVVLFAPLYISNLCANNCLYCAFKSDNLLIKRKALTVSQINAEIVWLLKRGHKRILMVCGEQAPQGKTGISYYLDAVKAIYAAQADKNRIKRVNVNCAPLTVSEFQQLKASGIGTYQIFQETYHEKTYRLMHPAGPKSDPDYRITAPDRAFKAGIDDIGIGALFGLYDYRFEVLGLLSHIEHLEEEFGIGPHTISVPRIEPAEGSDLSLCPPYKISDDEFMKIVAVLRLSVPYTGIIMSTRENALMRDRLLSLGVSQVSAESNTSPGGYSASANTQAGRQFSLGDQRSLDEIVGALIAHDYIPSFCAACYRMERTGKSFMDLARPGTIKGKCSMNALITLQEYLDDFASSSVKAEGYKMISRYFKQLDAVDQDRLKLFFAHVAQGTRDEYV